MFEGFSANLQIKFKAHRDRVKKLKATKYIDKIQVKLNCSENIHTQVQVPGVIEK